MKKINKFIVILLCCTMCFENTINIFAINGTESNIQNNNIISQFAKEDKVKVGLGMYGISDISNYSYNEYTNIEKLGKIINDYYAVGILIDENDNIHDVKIDHVYERLDFTPNEHYINTNDTGYFIHKMFISDKDKKGTNFCLSDGSGIDLLLLEKKILQLRNFNDVMRYLAIDSNRMLPILAALGDAYINSKKTKIKPNGLLGLNIIAIDSKDLNIVSTQEEVSHNGQIINRMAIASTVLLTKNHTVNTAYISSLQSKYIVNTDGQIINKEKTENIIPATFSQINNKYDSMKVEEVSYNIKEIQDYTIGKACINAQRNW